MQSTVGLMVRIHPFQGRGRGPIPRRRTLLFHLSTLLPTPVLFHTSEVADQVDRQARKLVVANTSNQCSTA